MNVKLESDSTFQRVQAWMLRDTGRAGVKKVSGINAAIATDVGVKRSQNQDRAVIVRGIDSYGDIFLLAIVCDGMGGMQDGEYCAATTISAFLSSFFKLSQGAGMPNDWLMDSAILANKVIYDRYYGAGGATLSALLVKSGGKKANWINVGDSRIYKFGEAGLSQITNDDTIAGQLGKPDALSQRTSELLQYIGIGEVLEPHVSRMTEVDAAVMLISSDGVHYLPTETMAALVARADDTASCARRLVEVAKWCGGHDNATVTVVDVESVYNWKGMSILPGQYDIWDSFGELQIFDSFVAVKKVAREVESYLEKEKKPLPNDEAKRVRKVFKISKEKARLKFENERDIKSEPKPEKLPQLKISFPTKDE